MAAPERKAFWRFDGDEPTVLRADRFARRRPAREAGSTARKSAPSTGSSQEPVILRPQFGRYFAEETVLRDERRPASKASPENRAITPAKAAMIAAAALAFVAVAAAIVI